MASVDIEEFIGLRSKMYSFTTIHDDEVKKCKGISKPVVQKNIKFKNYVECLKHSEVMKHDVILNRSKLHKMVMYKQNRIGLIPLDTKRYILDDGITTLAYGNYKIKNI